MTELKKSKPFIWRIFFITIGFIALLSWNTVLSNFDYFGLEVGNKVSVVLFLYSCSGLIAFLLFPKLKKLKINFLYILTSILSLVFCVTQFVMPQLKPHQVILTSLNSAIYGFIATVLQSVISEISGSQSPDEMSYVSFGNGLAGIISNIVSMILSKIYLSKDKENSKIYFKVVMINIGVVVVFYVFFFAINYFFDKTFKNFIKKMDQPDLTFGNLVTAPVKIDNAKIIRTNIFLLLAMIVIYIETLLILTRLLPGVIFPLTKYQDKWKTVVDFVLLQRVHHATD